METTMPRKKKGAGPRRTERPRDADVGAIATPTACPEAKPFASGEASRLTRQQRSALIRDHVAREEARRAGRRVPPPMLVSDINDAPAMMRCVQCGQVQPERDVCASCGGQAQ
jgi:hypothetical protein